MILGLIAVAVVVLGALAAVDVLGLAGRAERVCGCCTMACAQLVVCWLIAGAVLRSLRSIVLVLTLSAWTVAWCACWLRRRPAAPMTAEETSDDVPATVLRAAAALAALAGATVVWMIIVGLVLPPHGADAYQYHLPTIAAWLHASELVRNPLTLFAQEFPQDGELLTAWPAAFLHSDATFGITQIAFAIMASGATASLARRFGASRPAAVIAGTVVLLTPTVVAQMTVGYVDVIYLAFVAFSLYFLVVALDDGPGVAWPRRGPLVLFGVAAGLALGTKSTGLIAVPVFVAVLMVRLLWRVCSKQLASRAAVGSLALIAVPMLVLGGWAYGRNIVDHGNPLYPVRFVRSAPGTMRRSDVVEEPDFAIGEPWPLQVARSWAHDAVVGLTGPDRYTHDTRKGGLGPQWVWLILPLLATWAFHALRRREVQVITVLAAVAIAFALQPYRWWARFTLVLVVPGAVAVALALDRSRRRTWLAFGLIALTFYSLALTAGDFDLGNGRSASAADVLQLAVHGHRNPSFEALVGPELQWLDDVPSTATIGLPTSGRATHGGPDFTNLLLPLYGSDFRRRVVPISSIDADAFRRDVISERVEIVVCLPDDMAARWAGADHTEFEKINESDQMVVYRVLQRR